MEDECIDIGKKIKIVDVAKPTKKERDILEKDRSLDGWARIILGDRYVDKAKDDYTENEKETILARYYNANGSATAIVAVVTPRVDWAAYIGGDDGTRSEKETIDWVAKHGCKLDMIDAQHFFREITLPYRK